MNCLRMMKRLPSSIKLQLIIRISLFDPTTNRGQFVFRQRNNIKVVWNFRHGFQIEDGALEATRIDGVGEAIIGENPVVVTAGKRSQACGTGLIDDGINIKFIAHCCSTFRSSSFVFVTSQQDEHHRRKQK